MRERVAQAPPESDLLSPYPHIVENLSSEGRTYYNVIVFSCFFLPRMLRLIGNDRFFSRHLYISLPLQQRRLEDEWRCSALSYFRQVSPPKSWPGVALSLSEPVRNQRARILPGFGLASTLASTAAAELAAACFFQPVL